MSLAGQLEFDQYLDHRALCRPVSTGPSPQDQGTLAISSTWSASLLLLTDSSRVASLQTLGSGFELPRILLSLPANSCLDLFDYPEDICWLSVTSGLDFLFQSIQSLNPLRVVVLIGNTDLAMVDHRDLLRDFTFQAPSCWQFSVIRRK